jgi:hypothetical protein
MRLSDPQKEHKDGLTVAAQKQGFCTEIVKRRQIEIITGYNN